jgi:ATP-binding protein involved in chromosome partitioning
MAQTTLSQESLLNALRTVNDPDLKRDIVTLGMVRNLEIGPAGGVSLRVVLTTPACPLKDKIEKDVRDALAKVPGIGEVKVKMDAEVRGKGAPQQNSIPGVAHIIAVSSGKGGVGKSTVAVNLAMSLALEGARVGLMDADVYGPNVPTMMGLTEEPKLVNDPVKGEMFIPPSAHHGGVSVKIMSMGFLVQGDQPAVWRGPMLHSVINQFCHKVAWGELDYLVVDMPPGTGDVQLSLAQLVPVTGAVMVSTPQEVAMQDVRKAFHMFEKVRIPIIGVVENMSYFVCDGCEKKHFPFGSEGGKILARKFNTEVLSQLALVPVVREGGDEGRPVVVRDPSSMIAGDFRALAKKVAQKASILASESVDPSQLVQIGRFN